MIFVFASTLLIGLQKSMQLAERVRFWERFLQFIRFAEDAFRYRNHTVMQVMETYPSDRAFRLPALCAAYCTAGADFPEAWAKAVLTVPADDRVLLLDFGLQLGTTDLEGQLAHLALCRARAEEKRAEARVDQTQKSRLYPILGAAVGAGAALLLC